MIKLEDMSLIELYKELIKAEVFEYYKIIAQECAERICLSDYDKERLINMLMDNANDKSDNKVKTLKK